VLKKNAFKMKKKKQNLGFEKGGFLWNELAEKEGARKKNKEACARGKRKTPQFSRGGKGQTPHAEQEKESLSTKERRGSPAAGNDEGNLGGGLREKRGSSAEGIFVEMPASAVR